MLSTCRHISNLFFDLVETINNICLSEFIILCNKKTTKKKKVVILNRDNTMI